MAPRQNVPAPPSGRRSDTTTTTAANQGRSSGGRSWTAADAGVSDGTAWGADFRSRGSLRENYYGDMPYEQRLMEFRIAVAQGSRVGLESVLDYYVERRGGGSMYGVRTASGTTIAEALEKAREGGPKLATIQQALYDAGYFDPDVYEGKAKVRTGKFDAYTQQAYTAALRDYVAQGGRDFNQFLRQQKEALEAEGGIGALLGAGDERAPLVIEQSSPVEIALATERASQRLTGRRQAIDPQSIVAGYQSLEASAQETAYGLAGAQGGTVTVPPTAADYAEQQIREQAAPEVGAYTFLGTYNALLQRLGLAG